jgi:membrane-associated protein
MEYRKFGLFNVTGGAAWVALFLLGGYFMGNSPVVKRNFHLIIVAIVILSVMPPLIEYVLTIKRNKTGRMQGSEKDEEDTKAA